MSDSTKPLRKVTVRLYEGDIERINALYPDMGHNKFVRELVHAKLRVEENKRNKTVAAIELPTGLETSDV